MVKIAATSLTVLFLAISAANAQVTKLDPSKYPEINVVPPVNSPQVQTWLKELGDLSAAPKFPLRVGAPPECAPKKIEGECVWTCDNCPADDITVCNAPNTWGLTFDDGPSVETPRLLNYLKTNKLTASFFLIGSNVIQHPEIVQDEVKDGHHLASHTWSHSALTTLTNEQIVAEMKWTELAVMEATGKKLKYMRPPYGDINNRVRFILKKMGYIPVDWTGDEFDTNDWRYTVSMTAPQVIGNFTKSLDAYVANPGTKGFYCLEHDVSKPVVDMALQLLPLGIARKLNFASVAGCENDANPYQNGVAPPATNGTPGATGSAGGAQPTGTGPSTGGPKIVSSSAGSTSFSVSVGLAAAAAAVVGTMLF
ncbi:peptidoglycan-N-acetylglucosamine deacetylase [Entomortierella parvispora]|uniref:Peptidoglycan-N-acetylglucosamine deacetylase n=1 Tax=Entomortierella parvispora TaxID=205924 RepID=A0A9P3LYT9_9FUNG|nr:peptidoglycan-N-acetylglucosamine deacetylase [Entomortierella parvispora]